ncbi:hypothetical protein A2886_00575 [candidate division WWE3 bacterium RIFCSPHIGHO2_01_FULL_42_13]|uniref:Uncharacterized protein n=1 Tax=candidate division WWE3 bacterium RIFCSPHIGHO2_01_FULL_42_13 TaxID=1802617 RepID=A0A1F4UQ75_UNCKA|nr:MAG: hypothetical protein A2886_00575 [candidate division WWE3 bacterium RIFCSPHIGHO2_01_FULL_42_13]
MKYSQSSKNKFRRKFARLASYITLFLVLLIIVLSGYIVFIERGAFRIQSVEVTGTKSFVSQVDVAELVKSRAFGQNILIFNSGALETSLLESFQGAKEIFVRKSFPSTLKISVIERTPAVVMYDEKKENFYLVDEEGYVLGQIEPGTTNFPEILYSGQIAVGYFLDENLVSAYFGLLQALDVEKISASSMSVHSDYVSLFIPDSIEVLVSRERNVYEAASLLSALLKQLATQGRDVKRVDLRYDKVIVSYR